jgi:hypothetical protein
VSANIWTAEVGTKVGTFDIVTPGYKRESARGVVFNNPFSTLKVTKEYQDGHRAYYHNNPTAASDGTQISIVMSGNNGSVGHISSVQPHTVDVDRLRTIASTAAISNIDSADVQGLVVLAELRQTMTSLLNPVSSLGKFLIQAAAGSKGKAGLSLANAHLATVYGILPMLSDISSILKALHNLEKPLRRTARGFAQASDPLFVDSRYYDNPDCFGDITITRQTDVTVRAGCLYEVVCDLGLSQFGLGLGNIPGAFWQLIPFSFLLDYVWNISRYIETITPSVFVVRRAQWITVRTFQHHAEVLGDCTDKGASWRSGSAGGDQAHTFLTEKTRVPVNLDDYTGIAFNPKLDVGKVLSSLSLSLQTLSNMKTSQKSYQPAFADIGKYVFKGWNNLYISLRK